MDLGETSPVPEVVGTAVVVAARGSVILDFGDTWPDEETSEATGMAVVVTALGRKGALPFGEVSFESGGESGRAGRACAAGVDAAP